MIRCPTLQVSQFLFPGQRSDTFLTDHVLVLRTLALCTLVLRTLALFKLVLRTLALFTLVLRTLAFCTLGLITIFP